MWDFGIKIHVLIALFLNRVALRLVHNVTFTSIRDKDSCFSILSGFAQCKEVKIETFLF